MKYKALTALRSDEVKPSLRVTPVLAQVKGGYRPHHIDVTIGCSTKKFVPIEHVGDHRRKILDLEDENAKLRELALDLLHCSPTDKSDCVECPHHIEGKNNHWCDIPSIMQELGIETAQ